MFLSFLLLASTAALASHAGPPVFVEIEVEDGGVRVVVTSEQEALLAWMGEAIPIAEAAATPELEARLRIGAERLLRQERGLDLLLDGEAVLYEVGEVKLFDEFGVGNTEPSIQVELDVQGSKPSSIELGWGLFERVEEEGKRVLPVLVSAGGEFDLMRANELDPIVRWESPEGRESVNEGGEAFQPLVARRGPPRAEGRVKFWRATRVVGFFLAGLALIGACFVKPARSRLIGFGLAALCALGAWAVGDRASAGDLLLPDEALQLFGRLHENVYLAFSGRSEDEIYDRLAKSVDGPLLDELYADVLKGLVLADDGGAICRVEEVEALESQLVGSEEPTRLALDEESYVVDWTWRVRGQVIHFGHEHLRENRYRAHYRVAPVQGAWRITDVDVLEHERTDLD